MGIFDLALLYNVEKLKGIVLLSVQMCLCAVKVLYTERKKKKLKLDAQLQEFASKSLN